MALHVIDFGSLGALIHVGIRVGADYEAAGLGGAPRSYSALIDTGASVSAISPRVAAEVQPLILGITSMERVGAQSLTLTKYAIRLRFEGHLTPGRWFDLIAVETTPATPGVDVLIGQDILSQIMLLSNGPLGKLVLMY